MIKLDDVKLFNFLQEKKSQIQGNNISFDGIFATLSFLFTLLTVEYNKISFLSNTIIIVVFWILFVIYAIYQIIKLVLAIRSRYTVEDLYNDIKKLEREYSEFSLLIIKDCVENHNDKILLTYDRRWKCYYLPYFRTVRDMEEDKKMANAFVAKSLNVSEEYINIELVRESETTKYSTPNKRTKSYKHRYYIATISTTNKSIIKKIFKINGKKYHWFSIDEMYQNRKIKRKNQDIVNELKEIFLS